MSRPAATSGHVFLCYAREDSDQVNELEQALRAAGIPTWRDKANLWPGQNWQAHIRRAITDGALVFLACFSSVSQSRKVRFQNEELLLAVEQARMRATDDSWLIPIRFDDCLIPDLPLGGGRMLTGIQRADLFGTDKHEALSRLIAAVRQILEPESTSGPADPESSGQAGPKVPTRSAVEVPYRIQSLEFSPASTRLVIAHSDGIAIWDVDQNRERLSLSGQKESDVCTLTGNNLFATVGRRGYARVWDMESGAEITRMHHEGATSISASPDGERVATSNKDTTRLWQAKTGRQIREYPFGDTVRFSPDSRYLAIVRMLGSTVQLFDLVNDEHEQLNYSRTSEGFPSIQGMAFSANGRSLAVHHQTSRYLGFGANETTGSWLTIWTVTTRVVLTEIRTGAPILGSANLAFSPDGNWLAAAGHSSVQLWDLTAIGDGGPAQRAMSVTTKSSWIGSVSIAFSPDGQWLAIGSAKQLQLWHIGQEKRWYQAVAEET